jgi:outer membrane protein assembly factor BamD (BamD/ComL family)
MKRMMWMGMIAIALLLGLTQSPAWAAREAKERRSPEEMQAYRLLEKAESRLELEPDVAEKMLRDIIRNWPGSPVRFMAWLKLGNHYMQQGKWNEAVSAFTMLKELKKPDEPLEGEDLELYLEAHYNIGVVYYHSGQYESAFPVLRTITRDYPHTVWANQAYYYIGMCHFARENWNRAIEALERVGMFMDLDSPVAKHVEAGRRFYIRIDDDDLPILKRLGREIKATVRTSAGDEETITCIPLTSTAETYIGSLPTVVAPVAPGDNKLQVLSRNEIFTTYLDLNTEAGQREVKREYVTKVVSSGGVRFTIATFDEKAESAYLEQDQYLTVFDADLDVNEEPNLLYARVVSRYERPRDNQLLQSDESKGIDLDRVAEEEAADKYVVRDEVRVTLHELTTNRTLRASGDVSPVRTGLFGGKVRIEEIHGEDNADRTDNVLACRMGDQVVAYYLDEYHHEGEVVRECTDMVKVVGEINNLPVSRTAYVPDLITRAKKARVEAEAYLELGKIFKSMGLLDGATEKCNQGIELADQVIAESGPIPQELVEEAFKLKWELYLNAGELQAALATCKTFARHFPQSKFADQALLKIGAVHVEAGDYMAALSVFESILSLPQSLAKAEAQYRMGEVTFEKELAALKKSKLKTDEPPEVTAMRSAIQHYKRCADLYPESEFAGESLAKLVDYYVQAEDLPAAEDLLEKVSVDYPDARFMDRMLLKWVLVAYKRGDVSRALEKCKELVYQYPESSYAEKARKLMPQLEKRLSGGSGAVETGEQEGEG